MSEWKWWLQEDGSYRYGPVDLMPEPKPNSVVFSDQSLELLFEYFDLQNELAKLAKMPEPKPNPVVFTERHRQAWAASKAASGSLGPLLVNFLDACQIGSDVMLAPMDWGEREERFRERISGLEKDIVDLNRELSVARITARNPRSNYILYGVTEQSAPEEPTDSVERRIEVECV